MLLEQTPQNQLPCLNGLRVLVVDDNDDCLWLVTVIFKDCQALTKTATSVDNAIQVIEEWKPDVVIRGGSSEAVMRGKIAGNYC